MDQTASFLPASKAGHVICLSGRNKTLKHEGKNDLSNSAHWHNLCCIPASPVHTLALLFSLYLQPKLYGPVCFGGLWIGQFVFWKQNNISLITFKYILVEIKHWIRLLIIKEKLNNELMLTAVTDIAIMKDFHKSCHMLSLIFVWQIKKVKVAAKHILHTWSHFRIHLCCLNLNLNFMLH